MQMRQFPEQVITGRLSRTREFMKRFRNSILPFEEDLPDRSAAAERAFLNLLSDEVARGRYFPHPPRGQLVTAKKHGIPRFIPCFRMEDAVVYFSCIDSMQKTIGIGRSANTFGGWSMGNEQRKAEDQQTASLDKAFQESLSPYPLATSMDPQLSRRIWKDFQTKAYQFSRPEVISHFAMVDVANFFDSISLERLENALRSTVDASHFQTLDLLMMFLHHWNREIEGYGSRGIGVPLDEVGDSSRTLSNFYLQLYDRNMTHFCNRSGKGMKYVRYTDDQILMAKSESDLLLLIRFAAEQLHMIGLSVNAEKVRIFESRKEFDDYWCFDFFMELGSDPDACANRYLELEEAGKLATESRHSSVLRALTWRIDKLDAPLRTRIIDTVLERGLSTSDPHSLHVFSRHLNSHQRDLFMHDAQRELSDVRFNFFSLHLCNFFIKSKVFDTPRFVDDYLLQKRFRLHWSEY